MKKMIFVLPSQKTGGGSRVFVELANSIKLEGYENIIAYPNNSHSKFSYEVKNNIKLLPIGNFSNSKLVKLYNVFKTLRYIGTKYRSDIKIITDPIMSLFIPLLGKKNVIRFIQADDYNIFNDKAVIRNSIFLRIFKFLTKISYSNKHVTYFFNSKVVYSRFMNISKLKSVKCNIVHPCVNLDVFKSRLEGQKHSEQLVIGSIARRHPSKGLADLITSVNNLTNIDIIKEVKLISHDDLSNFSLSEKVKIYHPDNDTELSSIYNTLDIFISNSWFEGFCLPPLEVMAIGVPVISSNNGGINEYAKDGINCLLYNPKDSDKLTELLDNILVDKELRERLSKKGLITAKEFTWDKSATIFVKHLNDNDII